MSLTDAIIAKKLCGGGGSVPKPLTYDYMPEGYPKKTMGIVTVMEEQALAFALAGAAGPYVANLTNALEIVEGQTYTVNWDGTDYECECFVVKSFPSIGNPSIAGGVNDAGEPFLYAYNPNKASGQFITLDTSASHTISVKTTAETVTPMAAEFLPNIPAGGGAVTTLHINVTAVNAETKVATFTADKTPLEMQQASANGPTWCIVSFAAGIFGEAAVSIGLPPAWMGGAAAFGLSIGRSHENDGNNQIVYAVWQELADTWGLDVSAFGS